MWMVDPRKMCDQHLLGEHVEIHMLAGTLRRKRSVEGFITGGLIEIHNMEARHAELVVEMTRRGMNHRSPLPKVRIYKSGKVNRRANLVEMARRCKNCRAMQNRT